jgi:hypothetical protein
MKFVIPEKVYEEAQGIAFVLLALCLSPLLLVAYLFKGIRWVVGKLIQVEVR